MRVQAVPVVPSCRGWYDRENAHSRTVEALLRQGSVLRDWAWLAWAYARRHHGMALPTGQLMWTNDRHHARPWQGQIRLQLVWHDVSCAFLPTRLLWICEGHTAYVSARAPGAPLPSDKWPWRVFLPPPREFLPPPASDVRWFTLPALYRPYCGPRPWYSRTIQGD